MNSTSNNQKYDKSIEQTRQYVDQYIERFNYTPYLLGRCNICGKQTAFFCDNLALARESLICAECGGTSRYRSITRGILRAIKELTGVDVFLPYSALCPQDLGKKVYARFLVSYADEIIGESDFVKVKLPSQKELKKMLSKG